MTFNSYGFLFYFLPIFLLLYYLSPPKYGNFILASLSYIFYGLASPFYTLLLLSSSLLDYYCAQKIDSLEDKARRKLFLFCSLSVNVGVLFYFKYWNFTWENIGFLSAYFNLPIETKSFLTELVLPIGISFYTFQSMSYTIDVYYGRIRAEKKLLKVLCYVAMFPQLVAGPIVRFSEISTALGKRVITNENCSRGVALICCGLAKKIILADNCAFVANQVFLQAELNSLTAWTGLLAFSFQIYFDFSAYSDIAIGLGFLLGFNLPKNFNSPYKATSFQDFWHRWHITLSNWVRDYIYSPLGGNRHGNLRQFTNLIFVMLLVGLWHGASWNFIIWGGVHGLFLAMERIIPIAIRNKTPAIGKTLIVFIAVALAWVLFRAQGFTEAMDFYSSLLTFEAKENIFLFTAFTYLLLLISGLIIWLGADSWNFTKNLSPQKCLFCFIILLVALINLSVQTQQNFIYFQF